MADTTTLKENLPTQVDGVRLIAFNITESEAGLDIDDDRRTVQADDAIEIGGTTYTVAELVPTDKARGDHANGWISLAPE